MSSSYFTRNVKATENTLLIRTSNVPTSTFVIMFVATVILAFASSVLGAVIDNQITKWQKDDVKQASCFKWFSAQLAFDILLLVLLARYYAPFIPWIQLTVSGIFSAVLFFSIQERLSKNALCTIKF